MRDESETQGGPRGRSRLGKRWRWSLVAFLVFLALPIGIAAQLLRPDGLALPDVARLKVAQSIADALPVGADVQIQATRLKLARDGRPTVTMKEVRLLDRNGRSVARLPELRVAFDRTRLMAGQLHPDRIEINGMSLTLARGTDGAFLLSLGDRDTTLPEIRDFGDAVELLTRAFERPALSQLRRVDLTEVKLDLQDPRGGRGVSLDRGSLQFLRDNADLVAVFSVALKDGGERAETDPRLGGDEAQLEDGQISLVLRAGEGGRAAALSVALRNVATSLIAAEVPQMAWMKGLDTALTGSLSGRLDPEGRLQGLAGELSASPGQFQIGAGNIYTLNEARASLTYTPALRRLEIRDLLFASDAVGFAGSGHLEVASGLHPLEGAIGQLSLSDISVDETRIFPEVLSFSGAQADFRLFPTQRRLEIGQLGLQTETASANVSGEITGSDDGLTITLDGVARKVTMTEALSLWPQAAIAKTRRWLAANVGTAQVDRLDFLLRARPGERPKVAMSAGYHSGLLTFLPEMPPLENASGFFSLQDDAFTLNVDRGDLQSGNGLLSASGTVFHVANTRQKPGSAKVDLQLAGGLPALLELLARPPVALEASRLLLTGDARISAQIGFPLGRKVGPEDITWVAQGNILDVGGDELMAGQSLRAEQLSVSATPSALSVTGQVALRDVPIQINLARALGPDAARDVRVTGSLSLSKASLAQLGVEFGRALDLSGQAPARFELDITPGTQPVLEIFSTLDGLALALPALGWRKSARTLADLNVRVRLGDHPQVEQFRLTGGGLAGEGAVTLNDDGSLNRVDLTRLQIGDWFDSQVTLDGRGRGRQVGVNLSGGRLDLRGLKTPIGSGGGAGSRGPISFALDEIVVASNVRLSGVIGEIEPGQAFDGRFTGRLNGQVPVVGALLSNSGRLAVRVKANDAGAVLASVGALRSGQGGELDLVLQKREQDPDRWDGRVQINDLVVRDAPALAELLSALSIVGMLEQMAVGGLLFATVESQMTLSPDGLTLVEGRANGPSMGITFEGLVSPPRGVMDLQGVVSPIYLVNGIGGALFARRGEGLFGMSYRMSGPLRDPNIQVNPLSILAPGVFRELFRRAPPTFE